MSSPSRKEIRSWNIQINLFFLVLHLFYLRKDFNLLPRYNRTYIIAVGKEKQHTYEFLINGLFVELMFLLVLLDIILVTFLKVLGQDNVAIFTDSVHSSFLTDCINVGTGDLVGPSNIIFQVNVV